MRMEHTMKEQLFLAGNLWKLSEMETIYEHPHKAVYSAFSEEYGAVILKINKDTAQLKEEYEMLRVMNSAGTGEFTQKNCCCKIWDYKEAEGMLLEERLLPGTVLREEESFEVRIHAFEQAFRNIHQKVEEDGRQTYLGWLEAICRYCEEHTENQIIEKNNLAEKAETAREICAEFFQNYPERVLLHGDLHHDNILLRENGTYAMIDPKGVIGPEILDLPRYIMNELDTKYTTSEEEHMWNVVRRMSEVFGYSLEEVVKAYFMEVILGNVWCVEDGEDINAEEVKLAEKMLKEVEGMNLSIFT